MDFHQTFVTGASWDTDDLITFLGQKVKVQGHTIAAEAHSTRRYRRVFLVEDDNGIHVWYIKLTLDAFTMYLAILQNSVKKLQHCQKKCCIFDVKNHGLCSLLSVGFYWPNCQLFWACETLLVVSVWRRLQPMTCRYELAVTSSHQWTLCETSALHLTLNWPCSGTSIKSPVSGFTILYVSSRFDAFLVQILQLLSFQRSCWVDWTIAMRYLPVCPDLPLHNYNVHRTLQRDWLHVCLHMTM